MLKSFTTPFNRNLISVREKKGTLMSTHYIKDQISIIFSHLRQLLIISLPINKPWWTQFLLASDESTLSNLWRLFYTAHNLDCTYNIQRSGIFCCFCHCHCWWWWWGWLFLLLLLYSSWTCPLIKTQHSMNMMCQIQPLYPEITRAFSPFHTE